MQTAQWQAVYLHGKGGNAREAEHYRALLPGWRVTGLDYRAQTPWEAREEFLAYFKAARRDGTKVLVIANSIGRFSPCRRWMKPGWTGHCSFLRWWIWSG